MASITYMCGKLFLHLLSTCGKVYGKQYLHAWQTFCIYYLLVAKCMASITYMHGKLSAFIIYLWQSVWQAVPTCMANFLHLLSTCGKVYGKQYLHVWQTVSAFIIYLWVSVWQTQPHLTTFKFHHGLKHIESRYCPSKFNHPGRTTQHTHDLTYDILSHQTAHRQMTFFPRTIPEWKSSPRSDHSTRPWFLRDQGLLPTRSLRSINEKWVSEGWSCAGWGSSPGTATVAGLV